jgi:MFS family permease
VGTPAPLYVEYERRFGVTSSTVSLAFCAYILLAAGAMLIGGRLSDHVGRRVVAMAALAIGIVGCLLLVRVDGPGVLIAARAVQGLAVGLGMPALGTFVVDLRRPGRTFLASLVASASPTLGVALGAMASGLLVDHGPFPLELVYVVFALFLGGSLVGVVLSPETGVRRRGAWASLRPAISVPGRMRGLFVAAIATFVASWALGGFYQSFGPGIAVDDLGQQSHFLAGVVVASVLGTTVVGGPLTARLNERRSGLAGLACLAAGVTTAAVALGPGWVGLFFVGSVVAGIGFGAACTGATRSLVAGARPEEVAGLISAVYLVSYLGAAVPSFFAGRIADRYGFPPVVDGYAVFVVLLAIVAGVLLVGLGSPGEAIVTEE